MSDRDDAIAAVDAYITALSAAERELAHLRQQGGPLMRRARTAFGLTLRDVAAASRSSPRQLSAIERGKKDPDDHVLVRLLEIMEVQHG